MAYAEHYTQRVAALAAVARSRAVRPMRDFLREDAAHVNQTWQWAMHQRAMPILLSLAESLWFLNDGITDLAASLFSCQQAEALLRPDPNLPAVLHALLLACMARTAYYQGQLPEAVEHARAALRLAQRTGHRDALGLSLDTLIRAFVVLGKLRQAQSTLERSTALHRLHGEDGLLTPMLLRQQGMLSFSRSDWANCQRLNSELVAIYRRLDDANMVVHVLLCEAMNHRSAGQLQRSIETLSHASDVAAAGGVSPSMHALTWCEAAARHVELTQLEAARNCLAQADAIAAKWPLPKYVRLVLCLAKSSHALALGQFQNARPPLAELLQALGRGEQLPVAEETFLLAATWFRHCGDRQACVDLLRTIGPQTFEMRNFAAAQRMLCELEAAPEPGVEPALPTPAQQMEAANQALTRLLHATPPEQSVG